MKMLETNPVPVVPLALQNLWGSFFSRVDGRAMREPFRRGLFSSVGLVAGEPVAPAERDARPSCSDASPGLLAGPALRCWILRLASGARDADPLVLRDHLGAEQQQGGARSRG